MVNYDCTVVLEIESDPCLLLTTRACLATMATFFGKKVSTYLILLLAHCPFESLQKDGVVELTLQIYRQRAIFPRSVVGLCTLYLNCKCQTNWKIQINELVSKIASSH